MSKKPKKTNVRTSFPFLKVIIYIIITVLIASVGVIVWHNTHSEPKQSDSFIPQDNVEEKEGKIIVSENPLPAYIQNDKGEIETEYDIPTIEEVDGGQFTDATTGMSVIEGEYEDLGWSEWYPTDTPEDFKNATLNKCIIANNKYGAMCVSLSRVYWWSYANRDVSTCGTGMAKGMMKCAEQNAGDDFDIYWADSKDKIQAGDWLVFDGGQYGHIGMALGPLTNGYVTLLGENQGGRSCQEGGAATNIINLNIKNLIGFYRPKIYIKVTPTTPDTGMVK